MDGLRSVGFPYGLLNVFEMLKTNTPAPSICPQNIRQADPSELQQMLSKNFPSNRPCSMEFVLEGTRSTHILFKINKLLLFSVLL